jgi:septum formation protein
MREIILASASPRRKNILKRAKIKFKSIRSNLNEDLLIKFLTNKVSFQTLVKILSAAKGISVIGKTIQGKIISAFDTIVVCKNKIISKPRNKKDALEKLLFISNKKHKVLTGIFIFDLRSKVVTSDYEETLVEMKKITKSDAIKYIETREPFGKAGCYAIQGKGGRFVKRIKGDYNNVVGLPLKKYLSLLKRLN